MITYRALLGDKKESSDGAFTLAISPGSVLSADGILVTLTGITTDFTVPAGAVVWYFGGAAVGTTVARVFIFAGLQTTISGTVLAKYSPVSCRA